MNDLLQDFRFAWRNALKKPATALLIIVTLALGIGANSAIFSMAWHVLLAPLPYQDGDRLVRIEQHLPGAGLFNTPASVQTYLDFREQGSSFSALLEYHQMTFTLLGLEEPRLVNTGVVNWNFFDVLGVEPLHGRGFRDGEDEMGAEPLILLSHDFWTERFNSDPAVVGGSLEMNNAVHRVIGVLPEMPDFPDANDIWITAASCPFRMSDVMVNDRSMWMLNGIFGKLHEHVSLEEAGNEVETIANRLRTSHPDVYTEARGYTASLSPIKQEMVGESRTTFLLLAGMAFMVVLIASANVANLNLARMAARNQELAIREAVGANPGRIARQVLSESFLFSLAGGALGLLIAYPSLGLLSTFADGYTSLASEIRMDGSVLACTLFVALLTGILSGSAVAFNRRDINRILKEGGDKMTASTAAKRRRQALLLIQFTLSFVILAVSALIILSLYRLNQQDAGYDPEEVLVVGLDLNFTNYSTNQQIRDFTSRLLEETSALPGVELAGVSATTPLEGSGLMGAVPFEIEGRPVADPDSRPSTARNMVSEDYFKVLNIPLQKGRLFSESDDADAVPVVIVNQSFERSFFPAGDALGQRISTDGGRTWRTVVGVVGNIRSGGLDEVDGNVLYYDYRQFPVTLVDLFVESAGDRNQLGEAITAIVHALDPQQAVQSVRTLEEVKADWLSAPRLNAVLISLFGLLALAVTLSGVLGVVAFNISQRRREIGVHMAVGANPANIRRIFLTQGLLVYLCGLLAGLLLVSAASPFLQPFLYETRALNPGVFLASALLLTLAVLAAMYVPALKASGLNPSAALHVE